MYNYCFKFYRSLITYSDKQVLLKDFRTYYFVLLLRALKARGFTLEQPNLGTEKKTLDIFEDEDGCLILPRANFSNDTFTISVEPYEDLGLKVVVSNRWISSAYSCSATHLLVFEPQESVDELKRIYEMAKDKFQTLEAIRLWSLVCLDDGFEVALKNPLSEQALIDKWLESKLLHSIASPKIYRSYCPSCKSQALEVLPNSHRKCADCGSVYTFYRNGEKENCLWFLKLRRQK